MQKLKRKRAVKSLAHAYEVKAEISNATLAKAKSALALQIYSLGQIRGDDGPVGVWKGRVRRHWRPV